MFDTSFHTVTSFVLIKYILQTEAAQHHLNKTTVVRTNPRVAINNKFCASSSLLFGYYLHPLKVSFQLVFDVAAADFYINSSHTHKHAQACTLEYDPKIMNLL